MRALIKQGLYLEAMQSYYELAGLVELKQHDPRVVVARQVEAVIRGPDTLVGKVETGGASGWVQPLSRHSFTLDNIQGQVKGLVIGCTARERTAVEYKPAMEWKVPASWGVCAVHVATEPRTTFDFIEFPDSPATRSGP